MKLNDYFATHSQKRFAKELGVSVGLVWQWVNGRTAITPARAVQIEQATGGLVTRQELREDWASIWPELK